jgi:hypothetical protein
MIDDLLEGARNINVQYAQPQQQKSEILARISHVDQSNLPDVTWCWCGRKMPAVELDLWICFIFHHFPPKLETPSFSQLPIGSELIYSNNNAKINSYTIKKLNQKIKV